jgi:hypothetical protein
MRSAVVRAKWTLAVRRAGLTATVLSLASCCAEAEGPCIVWAREGERYDIELLSLLTYTPTPQQPGPEPFYAYPSQPQPCGTGLDLEAGSVFQLLVKSERGANDERCNDGCYDHDASVEIEGVERVGGRTSSPLMGQPYLLARSEVRIGNCEAYYAVGVMPLSADFKTTHSNLVESDYVLFRELLPVADISACEGPGSSLSASPSGRCYDVWSIRVVNEQGEQVSEDI